MLAIFLKPCLCHLAAGHGSEGLSASPQSQPQQQQQQQQAAPVEAQDPSSAPASAAAAIAAAKASAKAAASAAALADDLARTSHGGIVVANTHILFNTKRGDVKLGQLRTVLHKWVCCGMYWETLTQSSPSYWTVDPRTALKGLSLLSRRVGKGSLLVWKSVGVGKDKSGALDSGLKSVVLWWCLFVAVVSGCWMTKEELWLDAGPMYAVRACAEAGAQKCSTQTAETRTET
eukprot:1145659-Pelagomonas_calceolata.AAC.3